MTTLDRKDKRIHSRISDEDKKIIEWGARVHGLDLSDYIRINMLEKAKKDIEHASMDNRICLSEAEWERFLLIMEEPSMLNPNLMKAFQNLKDSHPDEFCSY